MLLLSGVAYAQTDSLRLKPDTLLNPVNLTLDSLQNSFTHKSDSIKSSYTQQTLKIEQTKTAWQQKADSLNSLQLPSISYTRKIDSLTNQQAKLQQQTIGKLDSLKGSIKQKLDKIKIPKEAQSRVSGLTSAMDKVNVPAFNTEVAGKLGIPEFNPVLPNLSGNANIPGIDVPQANLPNGITSPDLKTNLPSTDLNTGKITDAAGQAGEIQQQVKEATGSTEGLEKAVEKQASKRIKGLPDQKLDVPGLPDGVPKSGDDAKEVLITQAKKQAVNHFAGKEAALVTAMEKMSKYKQKYNSVNSLSEIKDKKNYNEMKGKPLRERLVPAITWQFQSWHDLMLDVNPSIGYKLRSNLITGIGWNQRIAFNIPQRQFNEEAKVFGIRSYAEYELKKGFGFRLDIETMNTPIKSINPTDTRTQRDWVWGALVGIKQRYPIYKKLKGNAQLMYNVFDKDHRSPYTDRVNFRIGIEFAFKKKPKSSNTDVE